LRVRLDEFVSTRSVVRPEELDFESPGRRDYWIALEHDHDWADHLIPLTVWVGRNASAGRGLVACGANHGNEYEGPVALKHLLRELDINQVIGRIILVPVLNVSAFRTGSRASIADDGVNLNRAFVNGVGVNPALSGITHRVAQFWREFIWPHVHVAIDIHSGGLVAAFASCVLYHQGVDEPLAKRIDEVARLFGTPYLATYQNRTPGLLTSEGESLGKIMIGTEIGFGEAVDSVGVRRARHGVCAVAISEGQLAGSVEPIDHHADGTQAFVSFANRRCVCVATKSGIFEPVLQIGSKVSTGQILGYLHDFELIDEEPTAIRAQVDGVFFACAFRAPILQGKHVALVAIPR
jgi:N2-acetyl-L-2,4-diaminobutanoate deacetylase